MTRAGWGLACAAVLWTVDAGAGETLRFGSVPAWVVPVEAPANKGDAGAIDLRLVDVQTRIDAGGTHQFQHQRVKVVAPEGLQVAGNAVVQWQPEFGDATVHLVRLHRDGKAIDVLGDGKRFSVIRREAQLESAAMLDGILTALMPIADLRVGDEVEIAFTVDRDNPVLAGHIEADDVFQPAGLAVDRLHLRYSWPATRAVRHRIGKALPAPVLGKTGAERTLVIDRADWQPTSIPAGAPGRFIDDNRFQLADFADWGEVAGVMGPLYARAATLAPNSPVAAEAARIATASADPKLRAAAALQLVQGQVRYFANVDGLGGYTPADAEAVWAARSGDCKGKTVLLLALLRQLGIAAEPAVVSVRQGNGVDQSLPMPGRFDHVIVRATIGGKDYWLDGTRMGDASLDRLAVPSHEWALPLTAAATPVALAATGPAQPTGEWRFDLDARAGLAVPAKATGIAVLRGDDAVAYKAGLAFVDAARREELLRKLWSDRYYWVDVKQVSYTADDKAGEVRIGFTGEAPMDWDTDGASAKGRYEADGARLGRNLAPKRPAGVGADVPVKVNEEYVITHQTILLPAGGRGFFVEGEAIDQTAAGVRYQRTATLTGERFEMTATTRARAGEISLAEATEADKVTDTLFGKRLFVRRPYDYEPTVAELAKLTTAGPGTDAGVGKDDPLTSVSALIARGDKAGALARADKLLATGGSAPLHAIRAGLLLDQGRFDEGDAALDAALAVDSSNEQALSGKAGRLMQIGRSDDALILYDRLVLLRPDWVANYQQRAWARSAAGRIDGALADLRIVLDKQPDNKAAFVDRVRLLNAKGDRDGALKEADALVALLPGDEMGHALRGNVLALLERRDEAAAALNRSLALEPTANAYQTQLRFDLSGGPEAQLDDAAAAIRLEPARPLGAAALRRIAALPAARARVAAAFDAAARGLAGAEAEAVTQARAETEAGLGDPAKLFALIDAHTAKAPTNPSIRNDACWMRATRGRELDKALADCDAAIAARREPAYLDSRALVHLQRGDFRQAIADYDAALAQGPAQAVSLYGRGLAKRRAGDAKGGDADLATARKLRPSIDETYADYGLKP